MKLISLQCSRCGAPLEAPTLPGVLLCVHCKSSHLLEREAQACAEPAREDLQCVSLRQQLLALDLKWAREREAFASREPHGNLRFPVRTDFVSPVYFKFHSRAGLIATLFFVMLNWKAGFAIGILAAVSYEILEKQHERAEKYFAALQKYENERGALEWALKLALQRVRKAA